MSLTVLQLSDIHATTDGDSDHYSSAMPRLLEVRDLLVGHEVEVDAVVVSGDIIDRSCPGAFTQTLNELETLAEMLKAPLLPVVGNHDRLAADYFTGFMREGYYSTMVGALRVIVLDSSRGTLDDGQLDWLRQQFQQQPAGSWGSLLCLHHSPLLSPLPILAGQGLGNPGDLAAALQGSDTRLMLTGHYHHPQSGTFSGYPVWTGPSLCYPNTLVPGPGRQPAAGGAESAGYSILSIDANAWSIAPLALMESTSSLLTL